MPLNVRSKQGFKTEDGISKRLIGSLASLKVLKGRSLFQNNSVEPPRFVLWKSSVTASVFSVVLPFYAVWYQLYLEKSTRNVVSYHDQRC